MKASKFMKFNWIEKNSTHSHVKLNWFKISNLGEMSYKLINKCKYYKLIHTSIKIYQI